MTSDFDKHGVYEALRRYQLGSVKVNKICNDMQGRLDEVSASRSAGLTAIEIKILRVLLDYARQQPELYSAKLAEIQGDSEAEDILRDKGMSPRSRYKKALEAKGLDISTAQNRQYRRLWGVYRAWLSQCLQYEEKATGAGYKGERVRTVSYDEDRSGRQISWKNKSDIKLAVLEAVRDRFGYRTLEACRSAIYDGAGGHGLPRL